MVELLLDKGADIDKHGEHGYTPLLWAAADGHEAVVKLLLDRGAATETRSDHFEGSLPQLNEASGPHDGAYYLKVEEKLKREKGWTALLSAAARGHQAVVKLLLDRGASVQTKSASGHTALELAERGGREGVVNLLKEVLDPPQEVLDPPQEVLDPPQEVANPHVTVDKKRQSRRWWRPWDRKS
jgi:ankyrin repeat protein